MSTSGKPAFLQRSLVHVLLIILLGFLVYSNTFHVPFYMDDASVIEVNPAVKDIHNLWPPEGSRWFGLLTFAMNYSIHGLDVTGYHIVNLLIHLANALSVYWLVRLIFVTPRIGDIPGAARLGRPAALLSGLLFVCHPVQTQAVTYIVQRYTSLATLLYLLSVILYSKARLRELLLRSSGQKMTAPVVLLHLAALCSAVLAMRTKEIAFTLPLALMLHEFLFFSGSWKKRALYLGPYLLTLLIIPLGRLDLQQPVSELLSAAESATRVQTDMPRSHYLFTQFRVIITYLRLLFIPVHQNIYYDYPLFTSLWDAEVLLSLAALAALAGLAVCGVIGARRSVEKRPDTAITNPTGIDPSVALLPAFGVLWFFLTLSVESSIIPIGDVIFEHRVYLPSIGLIIAVTSCVLFLANYGEGNSLRGRPVVAAVVLFFTAGIVVLSIAAYQRNNLWNDKVKMLEDVIEKSPQAWRPYYWLGGHFLRIGNYEKASQNLMEVVSRQPMYLSVYWDLATTYRRSGDLFKAISVYRNALEITSELEQGDPSYRRYEAMFHKALGEVLIATGDVSEGLKELEKASSASNPSTMGGRVPGGH